MEADARASEPAVGLQTEASPLDYRRALAEFASGVTIITGGTSDAPVGFACQSFSALSLDPPLVLFCVDHRSRTWPALRESGRFCVNILGEDQREMCQRFGSSTGQKFHGLDWSWSQWSTPVLPGVLARIHADVVSTHIEGDHDIVVGHVVSLERLSTTERPLIFFRGSFDLDADATDALNTWSLMGGWI